LNKGDKVVFKVKFKVDAASVVFINGEIVTSDGDVWNKTPVIKIIHILYNFDNEWLP
jgi:hypothetical protein